MTLDVTFVELKPQPAAVIEFKTSQAAISADLGKAYETLMQHVQTNGIALAGPPFAIYGAMDGEEWIVTAGIPVAAPIADAGTVKSGTTPGGRAAHMVHIGPYDKLGETWKAFEQWSKANGQTMGNVAWESYIDDPNSTPSAELKTQLYWHV